MEEKLQNDESEYLCSECNTQVKAEDLICPNCGADLKETAEDKKISKIFSLAREKKKYLIIALIFIALVLTTILLPKPGVYIYWDDKMEVEGVTTNFKLRAYLFPRTEFGANPTKEYGTNSDVRWEFIMNLPGFSYRVYFPTGTDIIWRSKPNMGFVDGDRLTVDENHCLIRQSWTRKCWNSILFFAWKIRSWI